MKQSMSRALELEAQLAQQAQQHEDAIHAAAQAKAQVDEQLARLQAQQAGLQGEAVHATAARRE